ncbi:WYL domain-containing protein [Rhizobium oryzicola]|uniref:WYL domain-containing protein n=1 Tax=Rhizobium oryzicola TaxID=1232668 RepID=UPI00345C1367
MFCEAIRERRNVLIKYDEDSSERIFSPYIVYWTSKNNLCVAGNQVKNPSEPLERNEWRNFTVDKFRSVRLADSTFSIDHIFNPRNKIYGNRVVCHVKQYV